MTNDHLALVAWVRSAIPGDLVPDAAELERHLARRVADVGKSALMEFAYLQGVAAERWGAAATAHFGAVLRKARVSAKAAPKARWQTVVAAVERLPAPWQSAMAAQVTRSQMRSLADGETIWSSAYAASVITALVRWSEYASSKGSPLLPTGASLDRYGDDLIDPDRPSGGTTVRTASDYLARIHAGLTIVEPDRHSIARDWVVRSWKERADRTGSTTKTGSQIVGASRIYALGFELMERARTRPMRGLHASIEYRNGLLLAFGTALPQRARALSALGLGTTLHLMGSDAIHVRIPAEFLKLREADKAGEPFDEVLVNPSLASALDDYRRHFRPLFDDGSGLFPSVHARGRSIDERQIGRLSGDITARELGVRIPIHRLRDNVATEASEQLRGGRMASQVLLGHESLATGDHYDHSDARKASSEFGVFLDDSRTAPARLEL